MTETRERVTEPKEKSLLSAKTFMGSSHSYAPFRYFRAPPRRFCVRISSLTAVPRHVYRRAAVSDEALEKNDGVRMQE